jgi:hypothetical protein
MRSSEPCSGERQSPAPQGSRHDPRLLRLQEHSAGSHQGYLTPGETTIAPAAMAGKRHGSRGIAEALCPHDRS